MDITAGRLGKLFKPRNELSPDDVRSGLGFVVRDGICAQAMGALQGGAFMVAFALALGATNLEIGILAAIPFVAQLAQIPAILLIEKTRMRKSIAVAFALASRLVWLVIIAIPAIFLQKQGVTLLMFALAVSAFIGAVGGISWNSMLRDLVPEQSMGRLFSRRLLLGTIVALVLTLVGGYFVDFWTGHHPSQETYGYSILFLIGLTFGLAGIYFVSRTPEPAMAATGDEGRSLWTSLSHPFKDQNFKSLIFFASVWSFGINLATPFFSVYMLNRLGLDLFTVTIMIATSQVANILFLRIWGRLCDRFSNKSVLSVSCSLFLIVILAWTFTTMPDRYFLTIPLLVLIHILGGISLAGVSLASGNIALKLSPRGHAAAYLASHGLTSSIAAAAAMLLGGLLGDFFAVRELSFTLSWAEPGRELAAHALSFKALDFLFLFAFVIGLYSLHRLAGVKEEGEVDKSILVHELMAEVARGDKSLSTIAGLRNLTFFPLHLVQRTLHNFSWIWEDNESGNGKP